MRSRPALLPFAVLIATLSGCAGRPVEVPAPIAVTAPPAPSPAPFVSMVRLPPRLPDGSFATPNRVALSPAAALWQLRAGLNVAALGCRGADEAAIIAGYNSLLVAHRVEFAAAYRTFIAEYAQPAGFDDAMTSLYNYYALPPAQPGLCDAAAATLAELATVPPGALDQRAPAALARLDAPYVAVFAAQDAWQAARVADRAPATALASADPPQLTADRSIFTLP